MLTGGTTLRDGCDGSPSGPDVTNPQLQTNLLLMAGPDSVFNAPFKDPCVYVLTDAIDFTVDGRSPRLLQRIEALVAGGAGLIQLRDKRLSDRQLVAAGRAIKNWLTGTGTRLIINDRVDLAMACDADGVHLGQDDLPPPAARQILGEGKWIGYSTHSLEQARAAVQWGVDYIGVGPVFPSATKAFDAFVGLELLEQVAREIRLPAFAIGGIGLSNVQQVVSAGFRRIAVSSAVIGQACPQQAVADLVAELGKQHLKHQ
jgi:thiamine-phosphate pyrophosphorylase